MPDWDSATETPRELTVPAVTLILLTGRHGLVHRKFTGGRVDVVSWVLLRISRPDTIGPAGPDRQVEPGQHPPARG
jgi:hypothetical protein